MKFTVLHCNLSKYSKKRPDLSVKEEWNETSAGKYCFRAFGENGSSLMAFWEELVNMESGSEYKEGLIRRRQGSWELRKIGAKRRSSGLTRRQQRGGGSGRGQEGCARSTACTTIRFFLRGRWKSGPSKSRTERPRPRGAGHEGGVALLIYAPGLLRRQVSPTGPSALSWPGMKRLLIRIPPWHRCSKRVQGPRRL